MVAFLLKRGADMLARNQAGQTPFQSGATLADRLTQPLLLLGKKDDAQDYVDITPLLNVNDDFDLRLVDEEERATQPTSSSAHNNNNNNNTIAAN